MHVRLFRRNARINLALQGGGAHGAFTWGVLDRLLEDEELEISWVSATSAGAVNAVAVASGFSEGGKTSARNKLRSVWEAVHKAGVPDLLRLNPFLYGLSRTPHLAQMASLWSPYEFNPLGFDPLRRLLSESIDFETLRNNSPIELLIAAKIEFDHNLSVPQLSDAINEVETRVRAEVPIARRLFIEPDIQRAAGVESSHA